MAIINFGKFGQTGTYETFISKMVDNQVKSILERDSYTMKNNNIIPMDYLTSQDGTMEIIKCPEANFFLKEITKFDTSNKRQEAFREFAGNIKKDTVHKPENNIWFNKSSNGINIRLGNVKGDTGNQEPATLGDDCVHGVVVGRTGAGKSVLINNVILNLTTEYAPWELDLFLVDMKKVELSRYMANAEDGTYMTPHVSACGATSEVRYVVSMIQYLCDCMKARQALFAALGVQKIKDFRELYSKEFGADFVLPRILLLVDEFQQMFLEASGKERKILDECITAITKLGRATGVHLLFASQEMSGALGSKELANFKLRIALPCDAAISEQILGNSAASKVEEKGITLINKKGGSSEEDNIEYRTPFINDKEDDEGNPSEFQRYLTKIHQAAVDAGISKTQKFYQEDTQDKMEKIGKIKKSDSVKKQIQNYISNNPALIDAFILGTGVVYSNRKNDYESFFWEKGKKRNIGILCDKDGDIGNTLKILAENFAASDNRYEHTVIYENEILRSVYNDLIEDLSCGKNTVKEENYQEYFMGSENKLNNICAGIDYSQDTKKVYTDFILNYINSMSKEEKESYIHPDFKASYKEKSFGNQILIMLDSIPSEKFASTMDEIVDILSSKCNELKEEAKTKRDASKNFDDIKKVKDARNDVKPNKEKLYVCMALARILSSFDSRRKTKNEKLLKAYNMFLESVKCGKYMRDIQVIWLIGTDNIDKEQDKQLPKILEKCTNQGQIFILAGSNPENLEMSYRCCNYMFINSASEKLYTKYKMSFTKKSDDNKTIDFKIINYNQERAYKQLAFECKAENAPKLDFEEIEV